MNVHLTPRAQQILNDLLSRQPERRPEEIIEQGLRAIAATEPAQKGLHEMEPAEIKQWLKDMAAYSDQIHIDPNTTFSREILYADDDE